MRLYLVIVEFCSKLCMQDRWIVSTCLCLGMMDRDLTSARVIASHCDLIWNGTWVAITEVQYSYRLGGSAVQRQNVQSRGFATGKVGGVTSENIGNNVIDDGGRWNRTERQGIKSALE